MQEGGRIILQPRPLASCRCKMGVGVMMLGLSLPIFTLLHVAISLAAILAGLFVMVALLGNRVRSGWTVAFLTLTILTSITGFMFPFATLLPSHILGIISLVLLAVACFALYGRH